MYLRKYYPVSSEAPATILSYYGQVGVLNERLQECEFMHARGREIALQAGSLHIASLNLMAMISRALQGGKNLLVLKEEVELELKKAENSNEEMAVQLKNSASMTIDIPGLLIFQRLVGTLIDGESTSNEPQSQQGTIMLDILHQGLVMSTVYFGMYEETLENAKKIQTRSLFAVLYSAFYTGIASTRLAREMKSGDLIGSAKASLLKLESALECSEWNFSNKVSLLRAELASVEGECVMAQQHFDAAINASISSKFIHEEALACELAGMHCRSNNQTANALNLLQNAERCYTEWGSKVKASQMRTTIDAINITN
jgi:ATP-dependent RNA helicase DDX31/DBP7